MFETWEILHCNIVQVNNHVKIRIQTSKNVKMTDILCHFYPYILTEKLNMD